MIENKSLFSPIFSTYRKANNTFLSSTKTASYCVAIFLGVGKVVGRLQSLSKKATDAISQECVRLNIKKGSLVDTVRHVDILYFRRFVSLNSQSGEANCKLGSALLNKGRINEAALYLQRAALWDSNNISDYLKMVKIYQNRQKFNEAHDVLKTATAYDKKGVYSKVISELKRGVEEQFNSLGVVPKDI